VPGTFFRNRRILGLLTLAICVVIALGLILMAVSGPDPAEPGSMKRGPKTGEEPPRLPAVAPDREPPSGTGLTLRCAIVDRSGRPLPGAEVRVFSPIHDTIGSCEDIGRHLRATLRRTPIERAAADSSGRCEFRSLPAGRYDIEAEAPDHAVGCRSRVVLSPATSGRTVRIALGAATSLSGTVKNHEGKAIPGARVTVVRVRRARLMFQAWRVVQTVTDESGRFSFGNLARGRAGLMVIADGHPIQGLDDVDIGRRETVEIVLGGGCSVKGVVSDAEGTPVAGATVALVSAPQCPSLFATTATVANGTFEFENLPVGRAHIIVSASGYALWPAAAGLRDLGGELTLEPGNPRHQVVTLTCGATVTGRVTETGSGRPVVGASIRAVNPLTLTMGGPVPRDVTGDGGSYCLTGLAPGKHLLAVRAPGYSQPALWRPIQSLFGPPNWTGQGIPILLVVEEGVGQIRRDLELRPAARITGRVVTPDGEPVPAAWVAPLVRDGIATQNARLAGLGALPVQTDAEGVFHLSSVDDPEPISLCAMADGWAAGVSESFTAETGSIVDGVVIRLEALGALEGRVVGPDGAPLVGAWVKAVPARTWDPDDADWVATDGSGRFRFSGLPAGEWVIEAEAAGHAMGWLEGIDVTSGQATSDLILRLERGKVIEGVVLDPAGKPLAGAGVDVEWQQDDEDSRIARQSLRTDGEGRFRADGLSAGSYRIRAEAEGHHPKTMTHIAAGTKDLEIALRRHETITGLVFGPDGQPVAGAWIRAEKEVRDSEVARSGSDGTFCIDGLDEGKVRLHVTPPGDSGLRRARLPDVEIGSDQVIIRLDVGYEISGIVVDEVGKPVPGEHVSVAGWTEGGKRRDVPEPGMLTDDDGRFRFTGLDDGRYGVYVRAERPRRTGRAFTTGGSKGIRIVLRLRDD
jgi:protocatechuate 3,4-dioxygenase beta subunit